MGVARREAPVQGPDPGGHVEAGQGLHLQEGGGGRPQAREAAAGGQDGADGLQGGRRALRGVQDQVFLHGQRVRSQEWWHEELFSQIP